MTNISHEAVLSAAWILMNRAKESSSVSPQGAAKRENAAALQTLSNRNMADGDEERAKEVVRKLISAYLYTPTRISSHFHSW